MEKQNNFQFPILTIKKVKPLLIKGEKIFAYEIIAMTQNGVILTLYENKGLNLNDYYGQKMECLLEITKGEFDYESNGEKSHDNVFFFEYLWQKRLYEYFPELLKLRDDLDRVEDEEEDSIQELFETTATKIFNEWGLNGLNLGIYQDKPLLSSSDGFFLLNEYQFEEELEELELNEKVYIKIHEIYLRGIRPIEPLKNQEQIVIIQPPPEPTQPQPEVKKKRTFFT